MERGTIVLCKFPFTDLSSVKRRPGLVISAKPNDTDDIIIAFISSVVPQSIGDTDYALGPGHSDFEGSGLKKGSVIKLDKIATINRSIVSGEMGKISGKTIKEIDKCLLLALGLG